MHTNLPFTTQISQKTVLTTCFVQVAIDVPLRTVFDYLLVINPQSPASLLGRLVEVPFGNRTVVGIIVGQEQEIETAETLCKAVVRIFDALPALNQEWLTLCQFAAHYYLRSWGEVMLPALPATLRDASSWERQAKRLQTTFYQLTGLKVGERENQVAQMKAQLGNRAKLAQQALTQLTEATEANPSVGLNEDVVRTLGRSALLAMQTWVEAGYVSTRTGPAIISTDVALPIAPTQPPALHQEQRQVVEAVQQHLTPLANYAAFLLHGVTGSGKTETYLHLIGKVLEQDSTAQVLLLVPEINLTPQLESLIRGRFPQHQVATLHSGMAEGERCRHWLAAHMGEARIVLGTRLAILASLPQLQLIIVDEEHDASYKQQEGLRYSARDLAIWRAKQRNIPILLGSATPSLESWYAAQQGRYTLLTMQHRAMRRDGQAAVLPSVHLVNLETEAQRKRPSIDGLSQTLREAIAQRLAKGEQSLLYLNRRGYAPVLQCASCGWLSGCPRCSAHLVWHRQTEHIGKTYLRGALRCHHCGYEVPIPHHCPDCGNADLAPLGRGTQKLEETLATLFPQARVARIDADSTRRKGSAKELFDTVHAGEVDILIGTQMVAKGHDFQKVSLVGIINPDAALYSQDFRASERLFAQLMQVSGRAGRAGLNGDVLVQTRYPQAAVYQALQQHDYTSHAKQLLAERKSALLPPYGFQALLTVEAANLAKALAFLEDALKQANTLAPCSEGNVVCHDPVPRTMVKIARKERAQLLIESNQRHALQVMLDAWLPLLAEIRPRQNWQLERDPAGI